MTDLAHLRPRYHVRPHSGWVNDPNGPVVDRFGTVHVFFQSRPELDTATPVEWGHATSPNWVDWQIHPSAMTPDIHPVAADGVWSGNAIASAEGIRAYFSGFRHDHRYQSILTATSADGVRFDDARPAIEDPAASEQVDHFRDPFVWRDADGWWMAVGTGYADGLPAVRLYRSVDGVDWQDQQDLLQAPEPDASPYGFMWECPQVLRSGDQQAVLVSVMDHAIDGFGPVLCLTHAPDAAGRPVITATSPVDSGPNFYASSVWPTDEGGVLWGWITEGRDEAWWMQDGWAGMLSLPRRAVLASDGMIRTEPLPQLTELRTASIAEDDHEFAGVGAQFEFSLRLDPTSSTQAITLQTAGGERLGLQIDHDHHRLRIDRSEASSDPRADSSAVEIAVPADGTLRGFVDGSVLELFLPDRTAATVRFYPTTPPPWRLLTEQAEVRVWALRNSVTSD